VASTRAVIRWIGRNGRRIGVTVVGFALVLAGLVGLALPVVPGWLLIVPGLAILATEYVWAQRILDAAKRRARQAAATVRRSRSGARRRDGRTPGAR
jgi:uncharacterized protein (TIGR02611 family)